MLKLLSLWCQQGFNKDYHVLGLPKFFPCGSKEHIENANSFQGLQSAFYLLRNTRNVDAVEEKHHVPPNQQKQKKQKVFSFNKELVIISIKEPGRFDMNKNKGDISCIYNILTYWSVGWYGWIITMIVYENMLICWKPLLGIPGSLSVVELLFCWVSWSVPPLSLFSNAASSCFFWLLTILRS